jgi:hypothetical protein
LAPTFPLAIGSDAACHALSLLFVNSNAFLEFGPSHIIYIGGLVDAIGSSDAKLEEASIFLKIQ